MPKWGEQQGLVGADVTGRGGTFSTARWVPERGGWVPESVWAAIIETPTFQKAQLRVTSGASHTEALAAESKRQESLQYNPVVALAAEAKAREIQATVPGYQAQMARAAALRAGQLAEEARVNAAGEAARALYTASLSQEQALKTGGPTKQIAARSVPVSLARSVGSTMARVPVRGFSGAPRPGGPTGRSRVAAAGSALGRVIGGGLRGGLTSGSPLGAILGAVGGGLQPGMPIKAARAIGGPAGGRGFFSVGRRGVVGVTTRSGSTKVIRVSHTAHIGKNMPTHRQLTRLRRNLARQTADAKTILRITSPGSLKGPKRGGGRRTWRGPRGRRR